MKALYYPPPLLGISFLKPRPREVEFIEWVEEYGRPKMARIIETSGVAEDRLWARRHGRRAPPPVVRLVEAEFVSLLQ